MSHMKIGPSVSPQLATVRPAVERQAEAPRAEASARPVSFEDEFVSGEGSRSPVTGMDAFEAQPLAGTSGAALPESLEPFREALDNIARQLTPELLSNPAKLVQFVTGAVRELGIAAKDFMDAVRYVREQGPLVHNLGKDRVA